jgi:hypothetical protein
VVRLEDSYLVALFDQFADVGAAGLRAEQAATQVRDAARLV